jgi:hypothetical protein
VAREVIVKCDKCGSTDETEEFGVTRNGQSRTVAACGEHKGPLVELFDLGEEERKPKARRTRSTHAIVPIEEWEGPTG